MAVEWKYGSDGPYYDRCSVRLCGREVLVLVVSETREFRRDWVIHSCQDPAVALAALMADRLAGQNVQQWLIDRLRSMVTEQGQTGAGAANAVQ